MEGDYQNILTCILQPRFSNFYLPNFTHIGVSKMKLHLTEKRDTFVTWYSE